MSSRERLEWVLLAAVCLVAPGVGWLVAGGRGALAGIAGGFFAAWGLAVLLESTIARRMFPRLPRSPWAD